MASGILDGVRVLDLSRVLAGPWCGAYLADLGADVIKIEHPVDVDESRVWPPQRAGESAAFQTVNRNKRGMCIDLRSAEGAAVVLELVERSDVVIENFRPGTLDEFGLGYEQLAERNPRIIVCSVSAYGSRGPLAQLGGYEAVMQAFTGIMHITGDPAGQPARCGISALDLATGMNATIAVLGALLHRSSIGRGQHIEVSLMATALGLLNYHAGGLLLCDEEPERRGSEHPSLVPYGVFPCRDDQHVFIAAGNDRLWARMCGVLAIDDVEEHRTLVGRQRQRSVVNAMVASATSRLTVDEAVAKLVEAAIPASPVNTVGQFLNHPQVAANELLAVVEHETLGSIELPKVPLRFSEAATAVRTAAPQLGEHTRAVLAELGRTSDEIDAMFASGAFG